MSCERCSGPRADRRACTPRPRRCRRAGCSARATRGPTSHAADRRPGPTDRCARCNGRCGPYGLFPTTAHPRSVSESDRAFGQARDRPTGRPACAIPLHARSGGSAALGAAGRTRSRGAARCEDVPPVIPVPLSTDSVRGDHHHRYYGRQKTEVGAVDACVEPRSRCGASPLTDRATRVARAP